MSAPEPASDSPPELKAWRSSQMWPVVGMTWVAFPFAIGLLAAVIGLSLDCDSGGRNFLLLCCALPATLGLAAGVLWPAHTGVQQRLCLRISAAAGGLLVSAGAGLVFGFGAAIMNCPFE